MNSPFPARLSAPFGFLVIDKPQGMTSHDVVARVRRGAQIRRVGHAGTLDPMATGVLVVCVGAATRLSEYVMVSTKHYDALIRLGVETDTYDAEGQIVAQADPQTIAALTRPQIEAALVQGEQDQIPPMYSAIKRGGQKLYDLARKGETVERAPRRVWIEARLVTFNPPDVALSVICSAGTYIRSIAHDLGAALGVGGHLAALRRTRSGDLSDPVAWNALNAAFADGSWHRYLTDERRALSRIPEIQLDPMATQAVLHGRAIPRAASDSPDELRRAYAPDGPGGRFIAILRASEEFWKPDKVFIDNS